MIFCDKMETVVGIPITSSRRFLVFLVREDNRYVVGEDDEDTAGQPKIKK